MRGVFNVLMVGVGGQGILLASDILCRVAMLDGHDVKKSEVHGMSQRGGAVFSHVRFGDKVHSPVIPRGEAHVIFSLETLETLRWADHARPDGLALYLGNRMLPSGIDHYPEAVDEEIARAFARVVRMDVDAIQTRLDTRKVDNTVLLGALSELVPLKEERFLLALDEAVPEATKALNQSAFALGKALAHKHPNEDPIHVE